MGKLLPAILALAGLAGGVGAGLAMKPPDPEIAAAAAAADHGASDETAATEPASGEAAAAPAGHGVPAEGGEAGEVEYVKLNNQFVVPVVEDGRVASLVVLSTSLQVTAGGREAVFQREPKLRDAFLQVLFDHANAGGFDGVFTTSENLRALRTALTEVAQGVMGATVGDVLITDLVRQDS